MIEENGAEREERGAKRKCQRGKDGRRFRPAGKLPREPEEQHAAQRRYDPDAEDGGEPNVDGERPGVVAIDAERPFDIQDDPVGGQREEGGARRFVRVKVRGLRHVADIARAAELDHRRVLALDLRVHRDHRVGHVHPREAVAFAGEVVGGVLDRHADEVVAAGVAAIDEEVVDREATLLGHRAHFGEARVLVPAAALIEVGEGKEGREDDEELDSAHGKGMTNDE